MLKDKFETFENVKYEPLKVFNRVVMSHNIREDFGTVPLQKYLENFTDVERAQMMMMTMAIASKGADAVRTEVMKDFTPESEERTLH